MPNPPKLYHVDVKTCAEPDFCVYENSEWRFVKIKPLLLNNELLRDYIKELQAQPVWK